MLSKPVSPNVQQNYSNIKPFLEILIT